MMLKNLFFPPKCLVCGKVLPITAKLPYFCEPCAKKLPAIPVLPCAKCGKPRDIAFEKPYCPYCCKKVSGIESLITPFFYKDGIREAVLRFKFSNHPAYAKSFGVVLAERLQQYALCDDLDAIVPVPISKKRLRKRGYNQSMLLARALSKALHVPMLPVLKKIRHTAAQSTLSLHERKNNLSNAFQALPCKTVPHSVLLVDDIYTTGTTAHTCASVLRKAGVRRIYVCTVAIHMPDPVNAILNSNPFNNSEPS